MPSPLTLDQLNAASREDFVAALGDVFEHAPWVADAAAPLRPFPTVAALHGAMLEAVREAPAERQFAFIRAHPELGSRVKRADITADSQAEQGSLGLDRLSEEEFSRFSRLNAAYRDKFGFPFIICVRRHTRDSILRNFERRLDNDAQAERNAALGEIGLITRLRLVAKVDGPGKPKTDGRLSTHVLDTLSGKARAGVTDFALRDRGERTRAPHRNRHQRRRAHRCPADGGRAAAHRNLRIAVSCRRLFQGAEYRARRAAFPRCDASPLFHRGRRRPLSCPAPRHPVELHDISWELKPAEGLSWRPPSGYSYNMTKVEDIEKAVAGLAPNELARFRAWFEAFEAAEFDRKIERHARTGRLDRLAEEAIADLRQGRAREI